MTSRRMLVPTILLAMHIGALVFGLVGLLYVIPNLDKFADNPQAMRVYTWALDNAGATHIIFGALAMFAFGWVTIGLRRTALFFYVSYSLSLASELAGTGTGFPFGNYAYTSYLGIKVFDHVPWTIPLSWFYVGFACYLLATVIVGKAGWRHATVWTLVLGVWFLTVWDLVLDPAMAHQDLGVKFWTWSETGPYFGMPVKNFIGWSATGLLYMGLSRYFWGSDLDPKTIPSRFPLAVYTANTAFAIALSLSVGLWIPVLLALFLGVIPAAMAVGGEDEPEERAPAPPQLQPAPPA